MNDEGFINACLKELAAQGTSQIVPPGMDLSSAAQQLVPFVKAVSSGLGYGPTMAVITAAAIACALCIPPEKFWLPD